MSNHNITPKISREEALWKSFLLVPTERAGQYVSFHEFTTHYGFLPIYIVSIWAIVLPLRYRLKTTDVCHLQRVYFTCNTDGICTINHIEDAALQRSPDANTLFDPKYPKAIFEMKRDVKIQDGSKLKIWGISWRRLVPQSNEILNELCQNEHFFYTTLNQ